MNCAPTKIPFCWHFVINAWVNHIGSASGCIDLGKGREKTFFLHQAKVQRRTTMRKWMIAALGVLVVCSFVLNLDAQQYQAVPGKVTYYNETPRSISLTIVGQGQNIRIVEGKRLALAYNPKAATEVKFWYTDDRYKKEIGRLSVFNGDVYVFTPAGIRTVTTTSRPSKPAHEPDFTSHRAVIADLERMKSEGQAKKAQLVVVKANYAITTINNFMRLNPEGDPSILKQRWQEAYNEYKKIK
jgi:hypothetical protein